METNPQTPKRILIVDDDEPVRETIRSVLGTAGYRCECVPGGEQALKLLHSGEKFDLVTSDMTNWPMNGLTFLERIKNEFPDIPILMVTACGFDAAALECRRKGACDVLQKPFNREQLLQVVHRSLDPRPQAVPS